MKKKKSIDSLEDAFSNALEGRIEHSAEPSPADAGEGKAKESASGRRDPFQNVSFEISDDAMQVVMRASDAGLLTVEQVLAVLHELRVTCGIDKAALLLAVDYLRRDGGWPGDLIVAYGERPVSPYEISFPFLEQVGESGRRCFWLVDGAPLFSNLERLLASKHRNELNGIKNVLVKAVRPKTVIAQVVAVTEGKPGNNVFGESIRQEGFPLQIGANISYDEKNKSYVSEIYGYLSVEGNKFAVYEPLWITPDKMEGYYVCLPQIGERAVPGIDELVPLLLKNGIMEKCLHFEVISKLCEKLAAAERLPVTVKIAAGIQPQNGLDADIVFSHDYRKRAGTMRGDNSIDLRERNAVVTVCKGDLVAEKRMPTKGIQGINLYGQALPACFGKDKAFEAGQGVGQVTKKGRILYYAKMDGNLVLQNKTLSIVEVCEIKGDIDYGTGNISVNTDLFINGSIGAGFSVKCEGNLQIQGSVETGAFVVAKGNISIGKGVIGETTSILCFGNFYAQFVQDAEILAKGDITLGSYVYNGMVRSGGAITVKKDAESGGGKIVGGVVCASKGIECSTIGSTTNRNTVVALQASPEKLESLNAFEMKIQEQREAIIKMMRTLHLDSVDPLAIREKLERLEGNNKEMFAKMLLNLNNSLKGKNRLELEQKGLQEKIDAELEKAKIRVSGEVFQGCEVQIGTHKLIVPSDLGPAVIQLQDEKITI